jgi:hypothetical protein
MVTCKVAKGRVGATVCQIGGFGQSQHMAFLFEIVFVAELGVFVEPFGHDHLGRGAPLTLPVGHDDADPHKGLKTPTKRDHAKAKGHAQDNWNFKQFNLGNAKDRLHVVCLEFQGVWAAECSSRPLR